MTYEFPVNSTQNDTAAPTAEFCIARNNIYQGNRTFELSLTFRSSFNQLGDATEATVLVIEADNGMYKLYTDYFIAQKELHCLIILSGFI